MTIGTLQALADLDGDGVYETDISAYVRRERGVELRSYGRGERSDRAQIQQMVLHLDNEDGRFSRLNAGGAYFPDWTTGVGIQLKTVFNAVTEEQFTGVIRALKVDSDRDSVRGGQTCWLLATDMMEELNETEIILPAMRDVRTGTMIHRLLDYAESELGAEKIENPRFAADLSGWSTSGVTIDRVTTGKVLESPAAMEVTVPVAGSVLRDVEAETTDNADDVVSMYVWSDQTSGGVAQVTLDMLHGASVKASSGIINLVSDGWTRIAVAVNWGAEAGNKTIELVALSDGVLRVGVAHMVAKGVAFPARRIDRGKTILRNNTYQRQKAGSAIEEVRQNELGALFYIARDGAPVFEDKHHRWGTAASLTSQETIEDEWDDLDYADDDETVVRQVVMTYVIWDEDAELTLVYRHAPVPVAIPAKVGAVKGVLRIPIDFRGGLAREMQTPVVNSDYFINSEASGSGIDETGNVTLTFTPFGGGADALFENDVTHAVWLLSLDVRGRAVRQSTAAGRIEIPAAPIGSGRMLEVRLGLNSDEGAARTWGEYLASKFGAQLESLELTRSAPWPEASGVHVTRLTQMLERELSERVTVVNNALPWSTYVNGPYYVESRPLTIEESRVVSSMRLSPADGAFFRLDVSQLDIGALAA